MKMQQQTEIKEPCFLLDQNGYPAHPGYCRNNLYLYNKENIKKHRRRIKEWDFYLITDGRYKVELNFFNISYAAALTAEFTDLQTGITFSDFVTEPSSPDRFTLSPAADKPFVFSYARAGRRGVFETKGTRHRLFFHGRTKETFFDIRIEGERMERHESLTTLTPFDAKHCFYYTQKMNGIRTRAKVRVGDRVFTLDPEKAFMTIDWGRGLWPYRNCWIWSNGSTVIDGRIFGYETTTGFGDDSHASASALFYDGVCHKIGRVYPDRIPVKEDFMNPWHFRSEDGRFDLTIRPEKQHTNGFLAAGIAGHRSEQVYGHADGFAILDDGTRLEIREMFTFAEKVKNGW